MQKDTPYLRELKKNLAKKEAAQKIELKKLLQEKMKRENK